jgi:hypothetical protein
MAAPRPFLSACIPFGGLLGSALLMQGCLPPPTIISMAPVPNQAQAEAAAAGQNRVLPLSRREVFPRVLGVLMDLGYQVRSVNADLGQVNIYQAWYDETRAGLPELSLEATLLFQEEGGGTRIRILAAGRVVKQGKHPFAQITGSLPDQDAAVCRRFLELLEARLCPVPAQKP